MTVHLIGNSIKITAYFSGEAVIFVTWIHASHACTQDCRMSHRVKSLL